MLVLIGLGLHDEKDISLKGLEEARSCDILFAEFYTSFLAGANAEKIESLIGKKITVLKRSDVEENAGAVILEKAKKRKVGLLVAGDPLISTTHVQLRLDAKKLGIETKIIHNASIFSAAPSLSGLQNYKFGRSASIATPEKGFFPETPYDAIKENLKRRLHTLLFLDVNTRANDGMKILLQIEQKKKENVFTEKTLCVVVGSVGSYSPVVKAGEVKELLNADFGATPHTLIVPGELHFVEEEYIKEFGK